jgi:hypothetical protein
MFSRCKEPFHLLSFVLKHVQGNNSNNLFIILFYLHLKQPDFFPPTCCVPISIKLSWNPHWIPYRRIKPHWRKTNPIWGHTFGRLPKRLVLQLFKISCQLLFIYITKIVSSILFPILISFKRYLRLRKCIPGMLKRFSIIFTIFGIGRNQIIWSLFQLMFLLAQLFA